MITVEAIVAATAHEFGVTVLDIKSNRRSAFIVRPRHVAMYLARNMTPRSLPEIGRMVGAHDHSTVIHAVKRINQALATDPVFAGRVAALRDRIEQEAAPAASPNDNVCARSTRCA